MTTGTGAGPSGSNDRSSTRQGRGAGSLRPHGAGKWEYRWGTDSASHSVTLYASTETAAWRLARAERDRRAARPRLQSRATTWTAEGWLRVWVADETRWHPSSWRPSTRRRAVGLLHPILEEGAWTGKRLADIRPSDVTAVLRRQAEPGRNQKSPERGWSDLTLHHLHALLRVAFRDAVGEELTVTNPVRDAPAPKQRSSRLPMVLETDERRRLIRACLADTSDSRLLAIAYLAELGLRAGELRALRLDDRHTVWGEHSISIERTTRVRPGSHDVTEEGDTKSRASRRQVEVPEHLEKALSAYLRLRSGDRDDPHRLVWESQRGGYLPQSALAPALYRGLQLAQIDRFLCRDDRTTKRGRGVIALLPYPEYSGAPRCARCGEQHWRLRVHDLRHSALSAWLAAGHTPQAVARRGGHSTITLLSIYGHGLEEQDREIARKAEEAWTKGE
jgi:integrase